MSSKIKKVLNKPISEATTAELAATMLAGSILAGAVSGATVQVLSKDNQKETSTKEQVATPQPGDKSLVGTAVKIGLAAIAVGMFVDAMNEIEKSGLGEAFSKFITKALAVGATMAILFFGPLLAAFELLEKAQTPSPSLVIGVLLFTAASLAVSITCSFSIARWLDKVGLT